MGGVREVPTPQRLRKPSWTHFWKNFKCQMGDDTEIVLPYFRTVLSLHFGWGICQKLVHVGLLTLCALTDKTGTVAWELPRPRPPTDAGAFTYYFIDPLGIRAFTYYCINLLWILPPPYPYPFSWVFNIVIYSNYKIIYHQHLHPLQSICDYIIHTVLWLDYGWQYYLSLLFWVSS